MTQRSCVYQLFETWAAKEPGRTAVTSSEGALTYADLNARADLVALELRALGVGPEVLVGVCAPRSAALLVGALGIFKSGGAYLPIDPCEPTARPNAARTIRQAPQDRRRAHEVPGQRGRH